MIDRALIAASIDDLDRGAAHVFVFVLDELEHRFDDPRPTNPRERVRSARADPPVIVCDGFQEVLDALGRADLVEDLDGAAARKLVIGFQGRQKELRRVRLVHLDHDVGGCVHHVEIGIEEQLANSLDVEGFLHA